MYRPDYNVAAINTVSDTSKKTRDDFIDLKLTYDTADRGKIAAASRANRAEGKFGSLPRRTL